jgi:hypothetical protein
MKERREGRKEGQESACRKERSKKMGRRLTWVLRIRKLDWIWAPGAHVCNPSYSGGRDQKIMVRSPLGK